MKKNKGIFTLIILAMMIFVFAACSDGEFTLTRPVSVPKNVTLKDGVLVWDNVKNADEYSIDVNGEIVTSIASEFSGFSPLEQYTVRVRAKNLWSTSSWSPYISFKVISSPTNMIYFDGRFIWDEVEGAEYYVVKIDGEEHKFPKGNSAFFGFTESGVKTAKIKAVGNGLEYFDSQYSMEIAVRIEPILWSKVKTVTPLGDGSARLPYQIANLSNFKWLVTENNNFALKFRNKKIVQTANIDCRQIQGFEPIGTIEQQFIGEYDAKGFSIENLNIEADNAGIFGYVGLNGKIINLVKEGGKVLGISRAGGIVSNNFGTVMNCTNTGYVKASIAGGIVGENTDARVVINCVNRGEIVGSDAGGIVGWNWNGLVNSSSNFGAVSSISRGGGIVSMNAGRIISCDNHGEVKGGIVGGLAGENIKEILSSKNSGNVSTTKNGGGLVGVNIGEISHSYSIGELQYIHDVQSVSVGGLVGRMNDGVITSSFSTANIFDEENDNVYVGSVVGYYRSGLLSFAISTAENPAQIGNTGKYIGEIKIVTTELMNSKAMLEKLNSTVDYTVVNIYGQQMWIYNNGNYFKLYWEK